MSDPIETYNYDRLGNRTTVEVGTDNYDYDYFQDMNRLHRVTKGTDKTEFTYNVFGAVTKIEKFDGQTLTHREEWEYANSTVPKRFTKHNIAEQYSDVEYASPDATSYDAQKWLWQYRKGAFDTREQKRLLISPHGDGTDDNDDDYAHLWEYSLTGVAGELYILYKGLQTATTTEPNENKTDEGRRVYISPFKYYAAGGELQFQADGTTKEVHITDNLGSVRSIVIWDSGGLKDIKGFDYKPFGELDGGDEPTKHGFATAEYDGESSCFAMGMRMYSAELGRFLSVDPLFEAMPRHNPYHYSFNSPLVWKDPSGLAPEKEQDRLMGQPSSTLVGESTTALVEQQIEFTNMSNTFRLRTQLMVMETYFASEGINISITGDAGGSVGGGGGGGGRTGSAGSYTFDIKQRVYGAATIAYLNELSREGDYPEYQTSTITVYANRYNPELEDALMGADALQGLINGTILGILRSVTAGLFNNFLQGNPNTAAGRYMNDVIGAVETTTDVATAVAPLGAVKQSAKAAVKGAAEAVSLGKNSIEQIYSNLNRIDDSYLKQLGIDAHQLKRDWLGDKAKISHFDLYKDSKTNEIVILKKGGKGLPINTGEYIK